MKRRPKEERWSLEEVHAIRGTPGRPNPSSNDPRIPVRVRAPEVPIQRPPEQTSAPRGVRTENEILRNTNIHQGARVATECNMAERDDPTQASVGIGCYRP